MYKKLMFLISFVMLLGLSSPVLAADLEIPYGTTYTVSGVLEIGDMECRGTCVIPTGATLILNSESDVDGGGPDGVGGVVLVDGGTFIINDRINFGCDNDAYLIVDNGGSVINTDEKICIPDNDGGTHRLIVINGTVDATGGGIELDDGDDRDSDVQLACSPTPGVIIAKITTGHTDEDDKWDPDYWITRDPNEGSLYDYPEGGCSGKVLVINDLGGGVKEVFYVHRHIPPGPRPHDGAVWQSVDVILCWQYYYYLAFRYSAYLGTDPVAVENATIADPEWKGYYEPESMGLPYVSGECPYVPGECVDPDLALQNPITLQLWETYYWRVDVIHIPGSPTPPVSKGPVWSFTTGCDLFPGDINFDCVVNFADYAMLADDWREEGWFPDDVQP